MMECDSDEQEESETEYDSDWLEYELNELARDLEYCRDYEFKIKSHDSEYDSDNEHIVNHKAEFLNYEEWKKFLCDKHDIIDYDQYFGRYDKKKIKCNPCLKKVQLKQKDETIKKLKVTLLSNNLNLELLQKIYN